MEVINIVMPVYNEGENIKNTFSEIKNKIRTPFRIFIVYDFDEDNTLPAAKAVQNEYNVHFLKNKYGKGVLNAIKTGLEGVDDGAILVSMADLSDDYSVVDGMFEKIKAGYDVVCGSRYMKGGKQLGGPKFKGTLSRMAGLSLHYLTGIPTHDISNSFKMYTPRVIKSIQIESNGGFELGMEIVVKAFLAGFKITEVPSVWRDRNAGQSRFKLWEWLPHYLRWYFFALGCKGKTSK
jgi:glycosyltransferase involved in cell wall biosynthesis